MFVSLLATLPSSPYQPTREDAQSIVSLVGRAMEMVPGAALLLLLTVCIVVLWVKVINPGLGIILNITINISAITRANETTAALLKDTSENLVQALKLAADKHAPKDA